MIRKTRPFEVVREGTTEVFVLKEKQTRKGPGTRHGEPFYNPAMEMSRDLSVLVYQWFIQGSKKPVHLLDGLASSGIRGVRLAHEIPGEFMVTMNDWNEQAYQLIQKNIAHNHLQNASATQHDLNVLLSQSSFDGVDIDPFGSPAYFVDSAMRNLSHNGILACTATDTAPLCGVYPLVCLRRYGAQPYHSPVMQEIGLRILLGFLCREAGKYDKGIEPLLCHVTDYYFRVYVQIKQGKRNANLNQENLTTISVDQLPGFKNTKSTIHQIGPLWMGHLHKPLLIKQVRTDLFTKNMNTKHELWMLLQLLEDEAEAPPFFYTMESVAAALKTSPPRREYLFEKIREHGYTVTRTHITPTGFKTTAPSSVIKTLFQQKKTGSDI
ncbi:MAG: tRNA (guanine(10)-N(2))-dimethyltransferase [Methanobacteriota archaeon]